MGLIWIRVIPSRGSIDKRYYLCDIEIFFIRINICSASCIFQDNKFLTKIARVCIGVAFIACPYSLFWLQIGYHYWSKPSDCYNDWYRYVNPFLCNSHDPHLKLCCCTCSFIPPMMVPRVIIWLTAMCWLMDTLVRTYLLFFKTVEHKSLISCCSFWILRLVLFLLRYMFYPCRWILSMSGSSWFVCWKIQPINLNNG